MEESQPKATNGGRRERRNNNWMLAMLCVAVSTLWGASEVAHRRELDQWKKLYRQCDSERAAIMVVVTKRFQLTDDAILEIERIARERMQTLRHD